jgi:maltooligosyltrehalose synthase
MDKNTRNIVIGLAIVLILLYWSRKRSRLGGTTECPEVFNELCTECRQLFFEYMNEIDNNRDLKDEAEIYALEYDVSYENAKVRMATYRLQMTERITEDEAKKLYLCMTGVEYSTAQPTGK